jgi:YebC/PmpR family DNA-binding regulatory protein
MAGHSQFKNIMYRKGAQDAQRARKFTKIIREITVAAREGGGDASSNPRLRQALMAAREANMPRDNVDRALKKATTDAPGDHDQAVRYEGYGPQGIALIVEALTNNRNRTASDVRAALTKAGGSLGEEGSVNYQFRRLGVLTWPQDRAPLDQVLDWASACGADDVVEEDKTWVVFVPADHVHSVRDQLLDRMGEPLRVEQVWHPVHAVDVQDAELAQKLLRLHQALDDLDDVQHVFTNAQIAPGILQSLEG